MDSEPGTIAQVEDVEGDLLGLEPLQRLASQVGLKTVEKDRPLAFGEDPCVFGKPSPRKEIESPSPKTHGSLMLCR